MKSNGRERIRLSSWRSLSGAEDEADPTRQVLDFAHSTEFGYPVNQIHGVGL